MISARDGQSYANHVINYETAMKGLILDSLTLPGLRPQACSRSPS